MLNKNWTNNYVSLKEYFNSPKVNDIYKIYTFICNYIIKNPTRKFFFSISKIAYYLNMPYQTVYSAIKRLTNDGLLEIINKTQIIKYEGNEYKIYREIKVIWSKAKQIMSIMSLDSKAYKKLERTRYKKLAKQRAFTYIAKSHEIYKAYIEECGFNKYKNAKIMFMEYCKNVSGKYYNVNTKLNYISLEEANMFKKEEAKLAVDAVDPPDKKQIEVVDELLDFFTEQNEFIKTKNIVDELLNIFKKQN